MSIGILKRRLKRRVALIILDGWGIGHDDSNNPIYVAQPQNFNQIKSRYLGGSLQASGIAVGLPWNEEGNSEVGHLTIGAGKIIYQHYPRITLAIQSGEFFKNKVLLGAFHHVQKNNSALHLIGLLTEGNIHASLEHLTTLIDWAKQQGVERVKLHLISDGRDSDPRSFLTLLSRVIASKIPPSLRGVPALAVDDEAISSSLRGEAEAIYGNKKIATPTTKVGARDDGIAVASVAGRYFAMDRDRHWDRTQEYYNTLLGKKPYAGAVADHVQQQYDRDLNDQYLEPISIDPQSNALKNNDAVIFFNFREDRMRQLVAAFALPNFKEFPTMPLKNIYLATMIQYSDQFTAPVAFPPETVTKSLGQVLADGGKTQLRVAETEKYAHVTYFFNGLKDKPVKNEYRILVPSRNLVRHEDHPEMMAAEIADRMAQAIEDGEMDFILANFANADMIAHTGDFDAAITAVKVIDEQLGKIVRSAAAHNITIIITADHGNVERMINPVTGQTETKHDASPVPFYLVGKKFGRITPLPPGSQESIGVLSDVAPTVLDLMGLPKPAEMTGESLLKRLT